MSKKWSSFSKRVIFRNRIFLSLCLTLIIVLFCGVFALHSHAASKQEQAPVYKYYTQIRIEYGDTLWSIAGKYMDQDHYTRSSYISEVKKINHINENDAIKEGKTLIIPYYSAESY